MFGRPAAMSSVDMQPFRELVQAVKNTIHGPGQSTGFKWALGHRGSSQLGLPAAVKALVSTEEDFELMNKLSAPSIVANNPLWVALSPLVQNARFLQNSEDQAVLVLQLQECEVRLVLKAVAAERAARLHHQIQAEMEAAASLPLHPLLASLQAACFDSAGNWCCVMPYAGCSLSRIIESQDWHSSTTAEEKLAMARTVIAHSLVVYDLMQDVGCGYIYRDVKPLNVCVDPVTNHVRVIDFGLMVKANLEDFFDGCTPGYFTPEQTDMATFCNDEKRRQATNRTTDVFLTSFMGLEVAVGLDDLPWELKSNIGGAEAILTTLEGHAAASKAGYDVLISRVSCPLARDFFMKTMCSDPNQRLTPAQALQHAWLAGCRAAVQDSLVAIDRKHQQQIGEIVQLLADVPNIFIPDEAQQHGAFAARQLSRLSLADRAGESSIDSRLAPPTPQHLECGASLATDSDSADDSESESSIEQQVVKPAAALEAVARAEEANSGINHWCKKLFKRLSVHTKTVVSTTRRLTEQMIDNSKATGDRDGEVAAADSPSTVSLQADVHRVESCVVHVTGCCGFQWLRKGR